MSVAVSKPVHLLGLEGLSRDELTEWIDAAEGYCQIAAGQAPPLELLKGKIIANLFFEDSTRTRCSFSMAIKRLGGDSLDLTSAGSSVSKGETILDTALTMEAMGVAALVIRAKPAGSPLMVSEAVKIPVINAGDGAHEHPTQGLLDLLTMRQHLGSLEGRTVAIVGDIANSRVARSNVHALSTFGAQVLLIGPPSLAPKTFEHIASGPGTVTVSHNLDEILGEVDVIMMLRVQFERQSGGGVSSDYREHYGLTPQRAARLKPETIVMHPGPMNRGLEINTEVAEEEARSVIRKQVTNGVAVRMAVLKKLIQG